MASLERDEAKMNFAQDYTETQADKWRWALNPAAQIRSALGTGEFWPLLSRSAGRSDPPEDAHIHSRQQ